MENKVENQVADTKKSPYPGLATALVFLTIAVAAVVTGILVYSVINYQF